MYGILYVSYIAVNRAAQSVGTVEYADFIPTSS